MFKLAKIGQILILAVFVLLIVSGCGSRTALELLKIKSEESWNKYTEITKESEEDIVVFMKENGEVRENDFIQEKIDMARDWLKRQGLDAPEGVVNQWMPLIRKRAREAIDSVEILLSQLIEKFDIGENN